MKKTLLFAGLFATGSLMAQGAFTDANELQNGTYSFFVCDSNAVSMAEITGTGVTWDYSSLAKYPDQTKSLVVDVASATNYASSFPDATKYVNLEQLTQDYWQTDASGRLRDGIVISEANLGDVVAPFDTPVSMMSYPFNLNDVASSPFAGTTSVSGMTMPFTGTHNTVYDGFGTLKVGNMTINNVSRVHYTDTMVIASGIAGDVDVYMEQIEYYDLDNSSEPIFIYSASTVSIAGSYAVVLSKFEPTQDVPTTATNTVSTINFNLSPNPVKDQLMLNGDFHTASVQIINQAGQVVYTGTANNGSTISTDGLKAGIYVVKATIDNQVVTKRIVKI